MTTAMITPTTSSSSYGRDLPDLPSQSTQKTNSKSSWNLQDTKASATQLFHALSSSISLPQTRIDAMNMNLHLSVPSLSLPSKDWFIYGLNNSLITPFIDNDDNDNQYEEDLIFDGDDEDRLETLPNDIELQNKYLRALVVISDLKLKLRNTMRIKDINHRLDDGIVIDMKKRLDILLLCRDRQELRLSKLQYENNLMKEQVSKLLSRERNRNYDHIQRQLRLSTNEVINTKNMIFEWKQSCRTLSRRLSLTEIQLFANEDCLAKYLHRMECLENSNIDLTLQIEKNQSLISTKGMISMEEIKKLKESWLMMIEDYRSIILRDMEIKHKLLTQLQHCTDEKIRLEINAKKNQIRENGIRYMITSYQAKNNALEKKAKSLSKELKKRLKSIAPLNREISRLHRQLEETIRERDAFKEAMIYALDNPNSSSWLVNPNSQTNSSIFHSMSDSRCESWDISPSFWSCSNNIDTIDLPSH